MRELAAGITALLPLPPGAWWPCSIKT